MMPPETMREIKKLLGGTTKAAGAPLGPAVSGYGTQDWTKGIGADFSAPLKAMGPERFDAFAPAQLQKIIDADKLFRSETKGRGLTPSKIVDEVRAAGAGGGYADLKKVAAKYGIPLLSLLTALGLQEEPQGEGSQATPPGSM